jgi:glycosyltransferase involved in cell wall biosynthesis
VDRILIDRSIDLVWCLSTPTPTFDLPYVTTIWDLQHRLQPVFPEVGGGREWSQRERALSRIIGGASIVIVGTEAGKAEVERFYGVPESRIRRLAHPTPTFALQPPDSIDAIGLYGLAPDFVLYPAQFWAHKNHVAVLRALARLRDEHDVRLHAVFVGSDKGNEAHVQRVAAELGVAAQVRHLGFVPRDHLASLYRQAFALTYLSYFGPENLPPLEAFGLGCPVVAADVTGAQEQLGAASLLVPPGNDGALAEAIMRLRRDTALRQRLIDRGKERARSFTAVEYTEGMMAILDELEPLVRTWR